MTRQVVSALLVSLGVLTIAGSAAAAGGAACATRVNNTFEKLLECVTVDGVRAHQAALQAIADANGGTRVSGTPGYDDSADYVAARCFRFFSRDEMIRRSPWRAKLMTT